MQMTMDMPIRFFFLIAASLASTQMQAQSLPQKDDLTASQTKSMLRFGRSEDRLGELISICSGPNIDYSITEEEARELKVAEQYRIALIKSEPDLAAILVDHVDRFIAGESVVPASFTGLFRALSLRHDVDLAAVKRYAVHASRLQDKADQYKVTPLSQSEAFLIGGFREGLPDVLGAYPTREGEDYLIKMLEHPIVPFEFSLYDKFPSARAAGKSGSIRCLPGLEQTLKEIEPRHQHQMQFGDSGYREHLEEVQGYVRKLRAQNSHEEHLSNQAYVATRGIGIESESFENDDHATGWRMNLGLLGGLILVVALSCRVFRKQMNSRANQ